MGIISVLIQIIFVTKIGLLRGGRLLAEESPERLLQTFRTDSLEEVFLNLSQQQEDGRLADVEQTITDDQNNVSISGSTTTMVMQDIGNGSREVRQFVLANE